MTLTRERKVLLTLLGLGVCAIVVDRFLLRESLPVSAEAYALDPDPVPEDGDEGVVRVATAENSIRQRLERASERFGIEPGVARDAFMVPACWRSEAESEPREEAATAATRRRFSELFTLSAVVGKGEKGFATLHGPTLAGGQAVIHVGQSVAGHTLVELIERTAVFEGPDGRVTLELTTPALERGAAPGSSDNTPYRTPG